MQQQIEIQQYAAIVDAMEQLNHATVEVDGIKLEACKCYHYSLNPVHVLFNDNCPESLKRNIKQIFEENNVPLPIAD